MLYNLLLYVFRTVIIIIGIYIKTFRECFIMYCLELLTPRVEKHIHS